MSFEKFLRSNIHSVKLFLRLASNTGDTTTSGFFCIPAKLSKFILHSLNLFFRHSGKVAQCDRGIKANKNLILYGTADVFVLSTDSKAVDFGS